MRRLPTRYFQLDPSESVTFLFGADVVNGELFSTQVRGSRTERAGPGFPCSIGNYLRN